jgi:hypothetical protein
MKVNKKALEKLLDESVALIGKGIWLTESSMVYEKNGIQIQVVVTRDESEFFDEICPGVIED